MSNPPEISDAAHDATVAHVTIRNAWIDTRDKLLTELRGLRDDVSSAELLEHTRRAESLCFDLLGYALAFYAVTERATALNALTRAPTKNGKKAARRQS